MYTCLSGLKKLVKVDTTLWDTFLAALGELIGTAILVFLGCTGCIGTMGQVPPPLQIALTFGFAVMVAIQVFTGVIVSDESSVNYQQYVIQ